MSSLLRPGDSYTMVVKRGILLSVLIATLFPAHVLGFGRVAVVTRINTRVGLPGISTPLVPIIGPRGILPGPMKGIILPLHMPVRVVPQLPAALAPALPAVAGPAALPAAEPKKNLLPAAQKQLGSMGSKRIIPRLKAVFDGAKDVLDRGVFVSAPLSQDVPKKSKGSDWESRSEDRVSLPEEDLEAELGL